MASERDRRLAENEALFRLANERMAGWTEQHADEATEMYFCECADPECRAKITLRRDDYERVRSDSRQFVIAPGHEVAEIETVIESNEGWSVIEKDPEVGATVDALDPRGNS